MILTKLRYPADPKVRPALRILSARLMTDVDAGDDVTGRGLVEQIKMLGGVFIEERTVTLTHNGIPLKKT